MRVLHPSSANTELTDSCSQSLTTSGPQRALHERYGSVIVLVLTRSVSTNADLATNFGAGLVDLACRSFSGEVHEMASDMERPVNN